MSVFWKVSISRPGNSLLLFLVAFMKIVCFGTIYAVSLIVFWKVDFLSFLQDFRKFKLNYRIYRICSKVCKWGVPQQKMGMFHIKYGKIKDGPKNTKWSPPTIPRDRQTCIFCDLNLLQISGLTKARVREGGCRCSSQVWPNFSVSSWTHAHL